MPISATEASIGSYDPWTVHAPYLPPMAPREPPNRKVLAEIESVAAATAPREKTAIPETD